MTARAAFLSSIFKNTKPPTITKYAKANAKPPRLKAIGNCQCHHQKTSHRHQQQGSSFGLLKIGIVGHPNVTCVHPPDDRQERWNSQPPEKRLCFDHQFAQLRDGENKNQIEEQLEGTDFDGWFARAIGVHGFILKRSDWQPTNRTQQQC